MTFHKHAKVAFVLLLTLLISLFGVEPATARAHRHGKRLHQHHRTHNKKAHRSHGRRHSRHQRNRVRHAGRYLAAARRLNLKVGDVQHGKASWYGARYHGRTTSSGEVFDKDALTAAHLSLPFGTRVRVHNTDNDSTIIVRITDRGPFGRGRVIDVSEAAARELGIMLKGVCHVSMEVLGEEAPLPCFDDEDLPQLTPVALELPQPDHYYFLQVGAYAEVARAEALVRALLHDQPNVPAIVSDGTDERGQLIHRVLVGRFVDRIEAVLTQERLRAAGLRVDVHEIVLVDG